METTATRAHEIVYENTYIDNPDDYGENIIKETLKSNTKWMDYDPKTASIISKELSELIKEKVKALNYSRYKIIVQVTLGQKRETRDCFCSVQVYGLYIQ